MWININKVVDLSEVQRAKDHLFSQDDNIQLIRAAPNNMDVDVMRLPNIEVSEEGRKRLRTCHPAFSARSY